MAFWNAPTDDPRHAEHAVACALDMLDVLARFNAENAAAQGNGLPAGGASRGNFGFREAAFRTDGDEPWVR